MPFNVDEVTFDELEEQDTENDPTNIDEENPEDDLEVEEETVDEEGEPNDLEDFSNDNIDDAFGDEDTVDEEEEDQTSTNEEEGEKGDEENQEDDEEEVDETRFVDDLANQFGLDPEEDLGGDLEDTWDDALKVARKGAETLAQQEMDNFFEKYPDVAEYTRYRVNGGEPDKYQEEVLNAPTYEDLDLDGNESTQERVVREKLQEVDGFSDEKIDDKIERYKSGGYLKSEAEDAREIMSKKQEEKREQLVKEQEKKAEQRRQEQLEEQKRYKQTIHESDSIAGLQLPENQKDEFESYLFEPVDEDGLTQAEKDYQNMSREEELAIWYLTKHGLENLGDLVDNKASTKKADEISSKLKKTSSRSVKDRSEKSGQSNSNASLEGFDLDQQIG